MANVTKMIDAIQSLHLTHLKKKMTKKPANKVLVVVPHVPAPDRYPEDRPTLNLIRQLSRHHDVTVLADRPAPLEDPYRRSLLMDGVKISGGVELPPSDRPHADLKRELHKTQYRAVFLVSHRLTQFFLVESTRFSPQTSFILFLPTAGHFRQLHMEKRTLIRLQRKEDMIDLYRQAARVLAASGSDADAIRRELGAKLPVDILPSAAEGENGRWIRQFVRKVPVRRPGQTVQKLVSIIILCHNDLSYLKQCVKSVEQHTKVPYELIFVDNNSKDGTQKFLRTVKNARVFINPENLAFAKGNNQGIQFAKGEYILLLNADVVVTEGWLENMVKCAESNPAIGLVGPCTNNATDVQRIFSPYKKIKDMHHFAAVHATTNRGIWEDVHRLIAFCLLIKKDVLNQVGLLDEQFGPGGFEDYDFCLRVKQSGFKIVRCKEVFIHHWGGKGYVNMDYDRLRRQNREIFIDKWCRRSLEFLETLHA